MYFAFVNNFNPYLKIAVLHYFQLTCNYISPLVFNVEMVIGFDCEAGAFALLQTLFYEGSHFSILKKYSRSHLWILDSQLGGDQSMLFHGNQTKEVNVSYLASSSHEREWIFDRKTFSSCGRGKHPMVWYFHPWGGVNIWYYNILTLGNGVNI